jgi:DNA-binding transcriptional ArsR family regulator
MRGRINQYMKDEKENIRQEIIEIKSKLNDIHGDIKRSMEQAGQQHINSILAGIRKDFSNAIAGHVVECIEGDLECNMVKKCQMRETCKSIFGGFLRKNANLIKRDAVQDDIILKNQAELKDMRTAAPFDRCDRCFSEVSFLFEKQLHLMRSLRVYNTKEEKRQELSTLPEEFIVNGMLEPLSNRQRLQILKATAVETKTFSELSELTGLRGGNLLFHLQKLLDSGMILQRHERGDYMITEKGFRLLNSLAEAYVMLKE